MIVVLFVLAAVLTTVGAGLWFAPAGWIVAGLWCAVAAWMLGEV